MIIAGLKLALLGMGAVGIFLIILIMLIKLSFKLFGSLSAHELLEMEAAERKRFRKEPGESKVLAAVITAAIAAHRARKLRIRFVTGPGGKTA